MASLARGAGWGVSRKRPGATRAMPTSRTAPANTRSAAERQAELAPPGRARAATRAAGRDRGADPIRLVVADRFIASRGLWQARPERAHAFWNARYRMAK